MAQAVAIPLWVMLLVSCSGSSDQPPRQPDGSYLLACKGPLSDCLKRAERLCRDQSYFISDARDERELLGHESGESRVEVRKSEAVVFCGKPPSVGKRPMVEIEHEPVSPPPSARPTEPQPPPRACTPGATQACVGPAGCSGGQACAADGSRFEPCNCGAP